jgi:hypothetical protein
MAERTDTTESDSTSGSADAKTLSRRFLAFEALKITNFRFLVAADFFGFIGFNTRLWCKAGLYSNSLTQTAGWAL